MDKILVIIPSFNGEKIVTRTLESLKAQTFQKFDILIVDNASTDGTPEKIKLLVDRDKYYSEKITVDKQETNTGFAHAVNIGLKKATSENYLGCLLLNQDSYCEQDVLSNGFRFLHDKTIGSCSPIVLYPDGRVWSMGAKVLSPRELILGLHFGVAVNDQKGKKPDPALPAEYEVDSLAGCAMFISTPAIRKTGLFDERFFMYAEDSDYSVRLKKMGFRLICFTNSAVIHDTNDSGVNLRSRASRKKYQRFMSSQIRYLWKHHRATSMIWPLKLPLILTHEYITRRKKS